MHFQTMLGVILNGKTTQSEEWGGAETLVYGMRAELALFNLKWQHTH